MTSTTEAAPASSAPTTMAPVTKTGTGDDVVDLPVTSSAVVDIACAGCSGNFVVKTDGDDSLLVNTIGAYQGRHVTTGSLKTWTVTADSAWTITVSDLSTLKTTSDTFSSTGDDAFILTGSPSRAAFTNDGEGNFVVKNLLTGDLVVNEIGHYSGTDPMSAGVVQVLSDGKWTFAAK